MINVKNNNLELDNKKISLLKFGANWCGPCRALEPTLELIESDMPEINIYNVDIDLNKELTVQFGIRSVPAVFIIKDNEIIDSFIGVKTKEDIENMIQRHI